MRTTFDLPADIADTLRFESARRGGRAVAPMRQLIAEAVRKVFGVRAGETPRLEPRLTGRPGRAILKPPKGVVVQPVTKEEIDAILENELLEALP